MSGRRGNPADPAGDIASLETSLAHVLQAGTYASIALVAVGVVLFLARGGSPLDLSEPLALDRLIGEVLSLRAEAFIWLGILGIVVTPGLRVAGALIGFAHRGERAMVVVAFLILVVVAAGVIAGLVTG